MLDELLRGVYRGARSRSELGVGVSDVMRRTGFPRWAVNRRAQVLGITAQRWMFWKTEEVLLLREQAGHWSVAKIARKLGRSPGSVKLKAYQIGISMRASDTYSRVDAAELLGVNVQSVARWINHGWLRDSTAFDGQYSRIRHFELVRFIKLHPEEYDLRRVDQAWFKGALFPSYGTKRTIDEISRRDRSRQPVECEVGEEIEVRA